MALSDRDILDAFPLHADPVQALSLDDLLFRLRLPATERDPLHERLIALAAKGSVVHLGGRLYRRCTTGPELVGTLSMSDRGFGFVEGEDHGVTAYIDGRNLGTALHRDRVRVGLWPSTRGRFEGEVLEILERGTKTFVATLRHAQHSAVLHPQDARLPASVSVGGPAEAADGALVAAAFLDYGDASRAPTAKLLKVFERLDSASAETDLAIYDLGLSQEFPPQVIAEAEAFTQAVTPEERARRVDLTGLPLFTVDPETARDFDDAVYAERRPTGGFELWVAIADVAQFVEADTALDKEALARSTSVYFPDRVLPMLPERLSSDLCSLRPDEERLALVAHFMMEPDGELLEAEVLEAVIRSHARFTYARAARMLGLRDEDDQPERDPDPAFEALRPALECVRDATRARRHFRRRRGYLDLEIGEPAVQIDADGKVIDIQPAIRNEAHRMVEDAMLAANEAVAHLFVKRGQATLFRVHDRPPASGLERLRVQSAALGAPLELKGPPTPPVLTRYLKRHSDNPHHRLIPMLVLRSMARAVYDDAVAPHFGLGAPEYLHFTSPIRRYPDLLVHRMIKDHARGEPALDRTLLGALADHTSRRERIAVDAERTILDLYKAVLMSRHVGERFTGKVYSIAALGCFVQLDTYMVEGLVPIESLTDDDYELDERGDALVGRSSGRRLALGDAVEVEIASVELRRRRITLKLLKAPGLTAGRPGRPPKEAPRRESKPVKFLAKLAKRPSKSAKPKRHR